jgi:hypothetical protein
MDTLRLRAGGIQPDLADMRLPRMALDQHQKSDRKQHEAQAKDREAPQQDGQESLSREEGVSLLTMSYWSLAELSLSRSFIFGSQWLSCR